MAITKFIEGKVGRRFEFERKDISIRRGIEVKEPFPLRVLPYVKGRAADFKLFFFLQEMVFGLPSGNICRDVYSTVPTRHISLQKHGENFVLSVKERKKNNFMQKNQFNLLYYRRKVYLCFGL